VREQQAENHEFVLSVILTTVFFFTHLHFQLLSFN
jgi:hypothetical protein